MKLRTLHRLVLVGVLVVAGSGGVASAQCAWTGTDTFEVVIPAEATFNHAVLGIRNTSPSTAISYAVNYGAHLGAGVFNVPCGGTRSTNPFDYCSGNSIIPPSASDDILFNLGPGSVYHITLTVTAPPANPPVVNLFGLSPIPSGGGDYAEAVPMHRRSCP